MQYGKNFWAIEYGRGFVPSGLPHVFASFLFLNQDPLILLHVADAFLKCSIQQFEYLFMHWRELLPL